MDKWTQKVDPFHHLRVLSHFPNIRLIDQNAIVVQQNGEVAKLVDIEDEIPLLILNRHECNRTSIEKLLALGVNRRIFKNPMRLESETEYDVVSKLLNPEARRKQRKEYFNEMYPYADDDEWKIYASYRNNADREDYLGRIYASCIKQLNWDDVVEEAQQLTAKKGTGRKELERGVSLEANIARLPRDFLELMNDYGVNIIATSKLEKVDKERGACGLCRAKNGQIYLAGKYISDYHTLLEETIHYIDHMIGFTGRYEWIRAVELDLKCEDTLKFINAVNGITGKGDITDYYNYGETDRPVELLPDLYAAELYFDKITKTLKKQAAQKDAPKHIKRIVGLIEYYGGDKEQVLAHFFPRVWPLYHGNDRGGEHQNGFAEDVHQFAVETADDRLLDALKKQKSAWKNRIATGAGKSGDIEIA